LISRLLAVAFQIYFMILLARVILSWMTLRSQRGFLASVGVIVYQLTEPLLQPVRRALAPYQGRMGVDFAPLALYLVLSVAEELLLRTLSRLGL
jgi:YggT family protein